MREPRTPSRPPCWPLAVCVLAFPPGAILLAMGGGMWWAPWASIVAAMVIVVVVRHAQWAELARIRQREVMRRSEIDHGWRR